MVDVDGECIFIFEDVKKVVNQLKTKKFIWKKIYFWIRNWTNRK